MQLSSIAISMVFGKQPFKQVKPTNQNDRETCRFCFSLYFHPYNQTFLDQFGKFPLHPFIKFVMITSEHFITVKENPVTETNPLNLQTPRLLLKGLTTADAEALFAYRSLPEITRFQGWAPISVDEAVRFVEQDICHEINQPDTWFQIGIFLRENQTMIGDMGLHFLIGEQANNSVEIGITVAPGFQGRGFASEAVRGMLDFLFDTLQKKNVVASVDPQNESSMALMRRVGFQLEGIYKNSVLFRGEWADDAVFQMSRQQWHETPKPRM